MRGQRPQNIGPNTTAGRAEPPLKRARRPARSGLVRSTKQGGVGVGVAASFAVSPLSCSASERVGVGVVRSGSVALGGGICPFGIEGRTGLGWTVRAVLSIDRSIDQSGGRAAVHRMAERGGLD